MTPSALIYCVSIKKYPYLHYLVCVVGRVLWHAPCIQLIMLCRDWKEMLLGHDQGHIYKLTDRQGLLCYGSLLPLFSHNNSKSLLYSLMNIADWINYETRKRVTLVTGADMTT